MGLTILLLEAMEGAALGVWDMEIEADNRVGEVRRRGR